MSFDDDAAGEGAGFRPPPHPDDRLWRHPSEVAGARQAGPAPRPQPRPQSRLRRRPRWPWGVVVAVGTVGVVALTVGGTLVLGLRSQVGGGHGGLEVAATTAMTPSPLTEAGQPAWLGIEGYDQAATQDDAAAMTTSSGAGETWPSEEPPGGGLERPPPEAEGDESIDRAVDESTTTLGPPEQPGVVITSVDPTGPAAEALQPGDIVLEVDGEPVTDMDTLLDTLGSYEPGDQVEITYLTLGTGSGAPDTNSTSTVVVTLGERPADWSVEGDGGQ